jgi:tRNA A58 N-methylase Trm61
MIDIPRIFTISESEHRIHNPFTPEKYATLGRALRMAPGTTILDLGSGSGEMLCSWARDHQIVGTGVDMSLLFSQQAAARAEALGMSDRVTFIPGCQRVCRQSAVRYCRLRGGNVDRRRVAGTIAAEAES